MLSNIFGSIMTNGTFTGAELVLATFVSLLCGLIIVYSFSAKNKCSKSFALTLAALPVIVEMVIVLVNGNIGAGVAVMGAFSLVRFRSTPGRGNEITAIFLAMAVGLATGMGYVGIAVAFTFLVSFVNFIFNNFLFSKDEEKTRMLKITVPENLDFEGRFESVFEKYLDEYSYEEVRTANLGSLYKLTLNVTMKDESSVKEMLDEIRTLNGNLDISLGRVVELSDRL